jgi:hypothetical protein
MIEIKNSFLFAIYLGINLGFGTNGFLLGLENKVTFR